MPSTVVEKSQIASIAGGLMKKAGATATDLIKAVAVFRGDLSKRPETPLPERKVLELPEEQRKALQTVADIADLVVMPSGRRMLTNPELTGYIHLFDALALVKKALAKLDGNAKAVLHNHFDAKLEKDGSVTDNTPFHQTNGWFCVEDRVSGKVPGEKTMITREVAGGGPSVSETTLAALRDAGKITEQDYLRLTYIPNTRVANDNAIIARVNADPDFAKLLLDYATEVAPTPSINLRAAK